MVPALARVRKIFKGASRFNAAALPDYYASRYALSNNSTHGVVGGVIAH